MAPKPPPRDWPARTRALLLDYDGVVVRLDHKHVLGVARELTGFIRPAADVLSKEFYDGPDTSDLDLGRLTYVEFWQRIRARVWQGASDEWRRFTNAVDEGIRPDPKMLELVGALAERYALGLVTDNHEAFRTRFQAMTDLRPHFRVLVCSAELGVRKPHPEMYDAALRELGLRRDEVIYIDDSERNVAGARELGIYSLQFRDVATLRQQLEPLLRDAT